MRHKTTGHRTGLTWPSVVRGKADDNDVTSNDKRKAESLCLTASDWFLIHDHFVDDTVVGFSRYSCNTVTFTIHGGIDCYV